MRVLAGAVQQSKDLLGSRAGRRRYCLLSWGQRRLVLWLLLLLHHVVLLLLVVLLLVLLLLLHLARTCLRLHLIGIARLRSGVSGHCHRCLLHVLLPLRHCSLILKQHPSLLPLHSRILLPHGSSIRLFRRLGLLLQAAALAVQRCLLACAERLLELLQRLLPRTLRFLASQRRPAGAGASSPAPAACLCLPAKRNSHGSVKEAEVAAQ